MRDLFTEQDIINPKQDRIVRTAKAITWILAIIAVLLFAWWRLRAHY